MFINSSIELRFFFSFFVHSFIFCFHYYDDDDADDDEEYRRNNEK